MGWQGYVSAKDQQGPQAARQLPWIRGNEGSTEARGQGAQGSVESRSRPAGAMSQRGHRSVRDRSQQEPHISQESAVVVGQKLKDDGAADACHPPCPHKTGEATPLPKLQGSNRAQQKAFSKHIASKGQR